MEQEIPFYQWHSAKFYASERELTDWLLEHIENNPNITFSRLWDDACSDKNLKFNSRDSSMLISIDYLKDNELVETHNDGKFTTFFNISKKLIREKRLNEII